MNQVRNIAILIFNDVEVLDFAGPFEVFSVTGKREGLNPFNVYTVAETSEAVLARNHLSVNPHYTIHNQNLLTWIQQKAAQTELLLSVCTGALLLAQAGLLDGLVATTHYGAIDELKRLAPNTEVKAKERFVDNGKIILSAGISAGIDMSLYVVAKLLDKAQAAETAKYMEYDWRELTLT